MNLRKYFTWRRILIATGAAFVVFALMTFLNFQFVVKGEPFQISKAYLTSNKVFSEKLGAVKKIELSYFSALRYRGPSGEANYKIFVDAEKGGGVVYIDMVKSAGLWKVTEANLVLPNNQILKLK